MKQYQKLLSLDDVELSFEKAAIEAIADKAIERKTGARGLRSIMEETMSDIMFTAPSDPSASKCVVTADMVERKVKALPSATVKVAKIKKEA